MQFCWCMLRKFFYRINFNVSEDTIDVWASFLWHSRHENMGARACVWHIKAALYLRLLVHVDDCRISSFRPRQSFIAISEYARLMSNSGIRSSVPSRKRLYALSVPTFGQSSRHLRLPEIVIWCERDFQPFSRSKTV